MPKHTFKEAPFGDVEFAAVSSKKPPKELPSIHLPAVTQQLKGLSVGDKVELHVLGVVESISQRKKGMGSIGLFMKSSDLYPSSDNEFEELSKDES